MKNKDNNIIKYIFNFGILFLVIGLVIYFSLKDNFELIIKNIKNFSPLYLFAALLLAAGYRIFLSYSMYFVAKANNQKYKLISSIKLNCITQFFNGVTPFASGGQPSQIYYLHKENISYPVATNIVLQNFILYQTALILFGIFAIVQNKIFMLFPQDSVIAKLVIVGFLINFLVWLASFVLSFGKKFSNFVLHKLLHFLAKIKIIKDEEKKREQLTEYINSFYRNALTLKNHKKEVILGILANILALTCYYVAPFIIIRGMDVSSNITILTTLVASAYVMIIGAFVPIPGGTGGLEYGYIYFFGFYVTGSVLPASMLLWRTITYYLGMIVGGIMMMFYRKGDQTCE